MVQYLRQTAMPVKYQAANIQAWPTPVMFIPASRPGGPIPDNAIRGEGANEDILGEGGEKIYQEGTFF